MIPGRITIAFVGGLILGFGGCNWPASSEHISNRVLADVSSLSVPDTSRFDDIKVSMSGVLGYSTAFSLEGIAFERRDTLIEFVVYAKEEYKSGVRYESREVSFDTTMVLSVPQPIGLKQHFFRLTGANQVLYDSTYVRR